MIEVPIPQETVQYAQGKLDSAMIQGDRGLHKFGSEKDRILVGYIGEKVIMDFLQITDNKDDWEYDLVSDKGNRLEVKTISCKFKPRSDYWCTVNSSYLDEVRKQDADYYVFVRVQNGYSKGWILGWIPCKEFFERGQFIKKGTDLGKFKFFKANATILPISELNQFSYKINQ